MDSFQIIYSDIHNTTSTTSTNGFLTQKLENESIPSLEKAFIEEKPWVNNLSSISNDLVLNNTTTTTSTQQFINENKECQNIHETDSNINFDKYCLINGLENYIQKPEDESIPSLEKAFIEDKQNPCANLLSKIKIKKSRNLFGCFLNFKKR